MRLASVSVGDGMEVRVSYRGVGESGIPPQEFEKVLLAYY